MAGELGRQAQLGQTDQWVQQSNAHFGQAANLELSTAQTKMLSLGVNKQAKQEAINPTPTYNDNLLDPTGSQELLRYSDGGITQESMGFAQQQTQAALQQLEANGITDPQAVEDNLVSMGLKLPKTQEQNIMYDQAKAEQRGLFGNQATSHILDMQGIHQNQFYKPYSEKDNTGLIRQLGASAFNVAYDTADTLVGMTGSVLNAAGVINDKQDKAMSDYLNPLTEQKFTDSITGFNRNEYDRDMLNISKSVEDGRWGNALERSAYFAPEAITESITTIASYYIGSGKIKFIKNAGNTAKGLAIKQGLSKSAQVAAVKVAEKAAFKAGNIAQQTAQLARDSVGLNLITANGVKVQAEEFEKTYGRPQTAAELTTSYGINFLANGLDKWSFDFIVMPGKAKAIKGLMSELPKSAKRLVAEGVLKIATAAGTEGAQEFTQQWGELIGSTLNFENSTGENVGAIFNKKNFDKAATGAVIGIGSGGAMATPGTALNIKNNMDIAGQQKRFQESIDNSSLNGFDSTKEKSQSIAKITAELEKTGSIEKMTDKVLSNIEAIKTSGATTVQQVDMIKTNMNQLRIQANGLMPDNETQTYPMNFGETAMDDMVKALKSSTVMQEMSEADRNNLLEQAKLQRQSVTSFQHEVVSYARSIGLEQAADDFEASIEEDANAILESMSLNKITYDQAKANTSDIKARQEKIKSNFESTADPVSKVDVTYDELVAMKPEELEAKLKTYSAKGMKQVKSVVKKALAKMKADNKLQQSLSENTVWNTITSIGTPTNVKQANKINATAESITNTRAKTKAQFNPKLPPMERLKAWLTDLKNEGLAAYQEAKEGTPESDSKGPTSQSKTSGDTLSKEDSKKLSNLVKKNAFDMKTKEFNSGDLKIIEEMAYYTESVKAISKETLATIIKAVEAKTSEAQAKVIDAEAILKDLDLTDVKAGIKNQSKEIISYGKTHTRNETTAKVKEKLSNLATKTLTDTEQELIAATLGILEATGKLAEGQASKILESIDYENMSTKEKAIAMAKAAKKKAMDLVSSVTNPKSRNRAERNAKASVKKTTKDVKNSKTGREAVEASKEFYAGVKDMVSDIIDSSKTKLDNISVKEELGKLDGATAAVINDLRYFVAAKQQGLEVSKITSESEIHPAILPEIKEECN